ncbi:MAG: ExeM/NucH family extracellular endonuclease [Chloroflexi bacterium]|nr:ExeM/NucH family extracellular endonuclease [Chloroflexota bacterium]
MKKRLFFMLFCCVLLGLIMTGQSGGTAVAAPDAPFATIFSEGMYDGTGGSNGDSIAVHESNNRFVNDVLTMSGTGDMRNNLPSGYSGASGTWNTMLNTSGEYFQIADINTTGYTNLTLSFGVRKSTNAENGSGLTVTVSSDGINWTNLTVPALPTGTGTAIWHYRTASGAIPATANLRIRFTSSNAVEWRIDDVLLEGDFSGGDTPPTVSSTNPANNATSVAVNADLSVTFSEPVTVSGSWFEINCVTSGVRNVGNTAVTGGPTTFSLNPATDFAAGEPCTPTIIAAQVTDQDSDDPPDIMAANYVWSFTTYTPPSSVTKIHAIQGSGSTAASGTFTIEAIVTGDYQGVAGVDDYKLDGFFIQEEDADADANPVTSEGIFVYCATCPTDVTVGDLVQVTGASSEYFNMSQLNATTAGAVTVLSSVNPLPSPTAVSLPIPGVTATDLAGAQAQINAYFEPFEGMLVTISQELTVTEYFELSRYGQVVLAQNGRFRQFTDANPPSAAGYTAHLIDKARRTIILDDDSNQQNHALFQNAPVFHPTPGFSITNYLRGGDTIANLTGVLHWSFAGLIGTDAWRIRPVTSNFNYNFTAVNTRSTSANDVGGNTAVASFNVLNYFTTFNVRGAHSAAELDRQAAKIVAAIEGLNADVIGVMEIENNNDGAIANLVSRLNATAGAGTYAYIPTGTVGTDQITVGVIYKPGRVTPVGTAQILTAAAFTDPNNTGTARSRPAVAQTFDTIITGERFTVVVNHLKSKGSCPASGADTDQNDGQGCWNDTRQKGTSYLVSTWLPTLAATVGDPDFLILGDLNAYRREEPITNIVNAGYADLLDDLLGAPAYGYVFDGQLGYLDHALASPTLYEQVTGVTEWHINSDEVNLLDYNDTLQDTGEANFDVKPAALPLYEANAYRSSDHDPVLVGLFDYDLSSAPASYGYAWHARGDILHLGSEWSADRGPANDISDGVARTPGVAWTPNSANGSVDVIVEGEVCQSRDCFLNAWVDWNNSGAFDAGEQIFTNEAVGEGQQTLTFAVPPAPACFSSNPCRARFRLTETADDGTRAPVAATGRATTGEVEDYAWSFTPTAVSLQSFTTQPTLLVWPLLLTALLGIGITAFALRRRAR